MFTIYTTLLKIRAYSIVETVLNFILITSSSFRRWVMIICLLQQWIVAFKGNSISIFIYDVKCAQYIQSVVNSALHILEV
jgi:hypothetical protein